MDFSSWESTLLQHLLVFVGAVFAAGLIFKLCYWILCLWARLWGGPSSISRNEDGHLSFKGVRFKGVVIRLLSPSISVTIAGFCGFLGLHYGGYSLDQPLFKKAMEVFGIVQISWICLNIADILTVLFKRLTVRTRNTFDDRLVPLFQNGSKILVVGISILVLMSHFDIKVGTWVTGLGLGGVGVAFAAKDILANFFSAIMIFVSEPFKVGDWLIVGQVEGVVESVGFRSTNIRTFGHSLVSVPNAQLTNESVDNMGRRHYRRVKTTLGLRYDTSPDKIKQFLEGIKEILKAHPVTLKDNIHVNFKGFGDSSLHIFLYFFLQSTDWSHELSSAEDIYFSILKLAEKLGVEFAFPSQSVYLENNQ